MTEPDYLTEEERAELARLRGLRDAARERVAELSERIRRIENRAAKRRHDAARRGAS